MGAAAVVAAGSAAMAAVPVIEEEDTVAEIMRLRAKLPPFERIHFDRQVRLHLAGEPNQIDGSGDYTYEEYADGFTPDCINWINAGCPKGWLGPDKIRSERLARRRELYRQRKAVAS
jgi:hypothetical protein